MAKQPLVPIAFTKDATQQDKPLTILAGDVGGTKTNVALFRVDKDGLTGTKRKKVRFKRSSLTDGDHQRFYRRDTP